MRKSKTSIVDVECYLGDALIWGKASSAGQLKYRMMAVLREVENRDFLSIFCARYNFEQMPYDSNIEVDYVMDLDAYLVYEANYFVYEKKDGFYIMHDSK